MRSNSNNNKRTAQMQRRGNTGQEPTRGPSSNDSHQPREDSTTGGEPDEEKNSDSPDEQEEGEGLIRHETEEPVENSRTSVATVPNRQQSEIRHRRSRPTPTIGADTEDDMDSEDIDYNTDHSELPPDVYESMVNLPEKIHFSPLEILVRFNKMLIGLKPVEIQAIILSAKDLYSVSKEQVDRLTRALDNWTSNLLGTFVCGIDSNRYPRVSPGNLASKFLSEPLEDAISLYMENRKMAEDKNPGTTKLFDITATLKHVHGEQITIDDELYLWRQDPRIFKAAMLYAFRKAGILTDSQSSAQVSVASVLTRIKQVKAKFWHAGKNSQAIIAWCTAVRAIVRENKQVLLSIASTEFRTHKLDILNACFETFEDELYPVNSLVTTMKSVEVKNIEEFLQHVAYEASLIQECVNQSIKHGGIFPKNPTQIKRRYTDDLQEEEATTHSKNKSVRKEKSSGGDNDKNCSGCGMTNHLRQTCQLRHHADFNKSPDIPWAQSPQGVKYQKLKMTHLNRRQCLDGNGQLIDYEIPPAPTRVWDNNRAKKSDLRDEDEDIILGNTSLTRFEIASHLPTHFGLTRLNIINMAREIIARQNDNEVINPSRDERLTKEIPHDPVATTKSTEHQSTEQYHTMDMTVTNSSINSEGEMRPCCSPCLERRVKSRPATLSSDSHTIQNVAAATPEQSKVTNTMIIPMKDATSYTNLEAITTYVHASKEGKKRKRRVVRGFSEDIIPKGVESFLGDEPDKNCCTENSSTLGSLRDGLTESREGFIPLNRRETKRLVVESNASPPDKLDRGQQVTTLTNLFKNCRLARLTDGSVRRISDISEKRFETSDKDNDLTEEDYYEFQDVMPPGLDTDEEITNVPNMSNLPAMVCPNAELSDRILTLCTKYKDIFSKTIKPQAAFLEPLVLEVDRAKWCNAKHQQPPRDMSGEKQNDVIRQVNLMETIELISKSQTLHWSQVLLVQKPNKTWRFCVDYRALNDCLVALGWRIPNIKQLFERLGTKRAKYFAVVDLTDGYHQVPLAKDSRQFAAFITTCGLYEPNRVWMGLKTAGSYFQQQIAQVVLKDCIFYGCEVYIDDVIIYGETEEEFLANLAKVFERFRKFGVFLKPDKCVLGVNEIEYVGHVINQHGITMSKAKIDSVLNFPLPIKIKELRSFLGLVNYFRDHVAGHSTIVGPLYTSLIEMAKHKLLVWTPEGREAFRQIKESIEQCPTLFFLDESAPITLYTDASDYGLGGYLFQTIDGKERPIRFMSKAFSRAQLWWSTFAKEAYAIIYCIKKFDYLLRDTKFTLRTDHRNLLFLKDSSDAKVIRWNMALLEYNFTVDHIPGTENIVADSMSRLLSNPVYDIKRDIAKAESKSAQSNLVALLNTIHIPEDKYKLLKQFHNSQVGHFGFDQTLRRLREQGHTWKYMRAHIKKFLRECPMCQKMNPIIYDVSASRFTTASYEPFSRISMDTIGPLPESKEGYKFILVAIDCFTRIIELYPCKTTDAEEAARHMIEFISRYGTPDELLSDRGTQFANSVIDTLMHRLDSEHVKSLANSKQETAIVERANKEVLRFLIPLIYDSRNLEEWVNYLPLVRRIFITHPHDSTGIAPATLLYGSLVNLEKGIFPEGQLPPDTNAEARKRSFLDGTWIDKMHIHQDNLLTIARKHQEKVDAENMATRVSKSNPITEFAIGSYVLANYKDQHSRGKGKPPNKLLTIKKGPYKVVSHIGNAYKVQSLSHDNVMEMHVTELGPFLFDANHTDPFDISLQDEQLFEVEAILSWEKRNHPDIKIKRKQLFLKVKWTGYNDAHDSWEPVNGLYHLPMARDYLVANGLAEYIPASFKNKPERNPQPRRYKSHKKK